MNWALHKPRCWLNLRIEILAAGNGVVGLDRPACHGDREGMQARGTQALGQLVKENLKTSLGTSLPAAHPIRCCAVKLSTDPMRLTKPG